MGSNLGRTWMEGGVSDGIVKEYQIYISQHLAIHVKPLIN